MKKLVSLLLTLAMILSLCACGGSTAKETQAPETTAAAAAETTAAAAETEAPADTTDLIVFAAASMTETLEAIAELYKTVDPSVNLVFNFDSSGTLLTQIQEGADCDLFVSASPKQMNALDVNKTAEEGNETGADMLLADTRVNLLENKVVLAVPEGNPSNVEGFDQLAESLKTSTGDFVMAMGNADVPVGQYTQKIFAYYELDEEALAAAGALTYGTNVKEVTTQVTEATVACGVIYATDAYSAGLSSVDTATPEMCGQAIYPAAVLNISKNQDAAKAFLAFLQGDEATAIFEGVGFTALK